jgi:BASS family bile acid:Na+ symporter
MALVKVLALIMIVSTMIGAGLQVDRQRLVETLRQYGLLGRAFLANFVLVPLLAILLVRFFHVERGVAIGIVLMSMAPGVPFLVNAAGRAKGGSLSFAITISFCFTALSVITIPLTIALINLIVPSAPVPPVPALKFLTTLVVFQLVPLVLGALIASRLAPSMAEKVVKALHILFVLAALVLVVLIFKTIVGSVSAVYGHGNLFIIAAIGVFSILFGWLLGGPDSQYRRTLAIATLLRNIGLCVLIGTQTIFEGTLVLPTIFAYFVITFILSLPIRVYFTRTKHA